MAAEPQKEVIFSWEEKKKKNIYIPTHKNKCYKGSDNQLSHRETTEAGGQRSVKSTKLMKHSKLHQKRFTIKNSGDLIFSSFSRI